MDSHDLESLEAVIAEQAREIARLREGRLTEEEFQNLCHNFTADDQARFKEGCRQYQRCLFGEKWVDDLAARDAEIARLQALCGSLAARVHAAHEVIGACAARGRICPGCARELTGPPAPG